MIQLLKIILVLLISTALVLSGCSSHRGTNREEISHVYDEKIKAVKLKKKQVNLYFDQKEKCDEYRKNSRIHAAEACEIKLSSLDAGIKYYDKVIDNRENIIYELEREERELRQEKKDKILKAIKSGIDSGISFVKTVLTIGLILILASALVTDSSSSSDQ